MSCDICLSCFPILAAITRDWRGFLVAKDKGLADKGTWCLPSLCGTKAALQHLPPSPHGSPPSLHLPECKQ